MKLTKTQHVGLVFLILFAVGSLASPSDSDTLSDSLEEVAIPLESCDRCPVCTFPKSRYISWQPRCLFDRGGMPSVDERIDCLKWHLGGLVGQDHVLEVVMPMLKRKLLDPTRPLVLHFCGDNGVGKTHLARLISQSFSLRNHKDCSNKHSCTTGDSMHVILGTSYQVSVDEAGALKQAHEIWDAVAAHLQYFSNGIILFDDLAAISVPLRKLLTPLLSGSSEYRMPGHPNIVVGRAVIIITSDFRAQSYIRTQYTTIEDLNTAVHEEVVERYGSKLGRDLQTLGFWGLEEKDINRLVVVKIQRMKCQFPLLSGVAITHEAMDWFIGHLFSQKTRLMDDSGRYVDSEFNKLIENKIVDGMSEPSHSAKYGIHAMFASVYLRPAHVTDDGRHKRLGLEVEWINEEDRQKQISRNIVPMGRKEDERDDVRDDGSDKKRADLEGTDINTQKGDTPNKEEL